MSLLIPDCEDSPGIFNHTFRTHIMFRSFRQRTSKLDVAGKVLVVSDPEGSGKAKPLFRVLKNAQSYDEDEGQAHSNSSSEEQKTISKMSSEECSEEEDDNFTPEDESATRVKKVRS